MLERTDDAWETGTKADLGEVGMVGSIPGYPTGLACRSVHVVPETS